MKYPSPPRSTRPRPSLRRARSLLLWTIVGFICIQLSLAVSLDGWLLGVRDPSYGIKIGPLHRRWNSAPAGVPRLLMVGSSRAAYGLDAALLESSMTKTTGKPYLAYNFGIPGAGPLLEQLTYKRLKAESVYLDYLLVEVMPSFLFGDVPQETRFVSPRRLTWRELPMLEGYGLNDHSSRQSWWESWLVPWYGFRISMLSRCLPHLIPFTLREDSTRGADASGWMPYRRDYVSPEERHLRFEQQRSSFQGLLTSEKLNDQACRALRDLLADCQHDGVRPLLIVMPEGDGFRKIYTPLQNEAIRNLIADLQREYAAPLIDARTWVADEDFLDLHHLLARGAERFSERLGRELPGLLSTSPIHKH